ncbi:urease accessory protein UreF, partial [Photorhabdus kayaii]|nr:urease accessory protein UreF [Photorhabdus kayaii]
MNALRLIRIMQFADSVLPVGAFSFSNGLESAIQSKIVYDVATLSE